MSFRTRRGVLFFIFKKPEKEEGGEGTIELVENAEEQRFTLNP